MIGCPCLGIPDLAGGVSREIVYTATVFERALPPLLNLDSLVLHRYACSFRRASWRFPFRQQLPYSLCCEFGSFASPCFELRSIAKHLLTLASQKGTSE